MTEGLNNNLVGILRKFIDNHINDPNGNAGIDYIFCFLHPSYRSRSKKDYLLIDLTEKGEENIHKEVRKVFVQLYGSSLYPETKELVNVKFLKDHLFPTLKNIPNEESQSLILGKLRACFYEKRVSDIILSNRWEKISELAQGSENNFDLVCEIIKNVTRKGDNRPPFDGIRYHVTGKGIMSDSDINEKTNIDLLVSLGLISGENVIPQYYDKYNTYYSTSLWNSFFEMKWKEAGNFLEDILDYKTNLLIEAQENRIEIIITEIKYYIRIVKLRKFRIKKLKKFILWDEFVQETQYLGSFEEFWYSSSKLQQIGEIDQSQDKMIKVKTKYLIFSRWKPLLFKVLGFGFPSSAIIFNISSTIWSFVFIGFGLFMIILSEILAEGNDQR